MSSTLNCFFSLSWKIFSGSTPLVVTHLTDVDQGFDAWAELHECAERRDAGDLTLDDVALVELLDVLQPRVFAGLLEAEAQAVLVDSDDLGLDGVADLDVVTRVVDALPGNLRCGSGLRYRRH
jgi:hypothetical protein